MKQYQFFLLFSIALLASPSSTSAQTYSLHIGSIQFLLDTTYYSGYETKFVQLNSEVKKEWWRYVKSKAHIFNMKTHYILTVPVEKGTSNVPLKFVSVINLDSLTQASTLRCAIMASDMDDNQQKKVGTELIALMKDFKVHYFTKLIQNEIDVNESATKKISAEMHKYYAENAKLVEKSQGQSTIQKNKAKIEDLSVELHQYETELSSLKEKLRLIK